MIPLSENRNHDLIPSYYSICRRFIHYVIEPGLVVDLSGTLHLTLRVTQQLKLYNMLLNTNSNIHIRVRRVWRSQSEFVNRKIDNTMITRKGTKGQTTIYKTLHRKHKTEQHEPNPIEKHGWTQVLRKGN
jgi:hypothetical protein